MTERAPVHLTPEQAYALLNTYYEDAIKPAAYHHYASDLAMQQVTAEKYFNPLTQQLRSLLTDMPVILEAFHTSILNQNPEHVASHPIPFNQPLHPIFIPGDPELG
jgi:hypothetical protein